MTGEDSQVQIDINAIHPNIPLNRLAGFNLGRDRTNIFDNLQTSVEVTSDEIHQDHDQA